MDGEGKIVKLSGSSEIKGIKGTDKRLYVQFILIKNYIIEND